VEVAVEVEVEVSQLREADDTLKGSGRRGWHGGGGRDGTGTWIGQFADGLVFVFVVRVIVIAVVLRAVRAGGPGPGQAGAALSATAAPRPARLLLELLVAATARRGGTGGRGTAGTRAVPRGRCRGGGCRAPVRLVARVHGGGVARGSTLAATLRARA
jgi:hypothetical protein